MVSQRLKEMEAQGLITRTVVTERPLAVHYEMTDFGRSSLSVLDELRDWAETHDI